MKHREIAVRLKVVAKQRAGYQELAMGRHNADAMSAPEIREAFETLMKLEEKLALLLRERLERDRKILTQMGG